MSLWSINEMARFVRGHVARGRERFSFVAKNGNMFDVEMTNEGISVMGTNIKFGLVVSMEDPQEEWGHDPGDEHWG